MLVDCLKITEEKSSESRVHTPDARLIITTRAVPRRKGRSPRLSITVMAKTLSLKPASQHHCNGQDAELKVCLSITAMAKRQSLKPKSDRV